MSITLYIDLVHFQKGTIWFLTNYRTHNVRILVEYQPLLRNFSETKFSFFGMPRTRRIYLMRVSTTPPPCSRNLSGFINSNRKSCAIFFNRDHFVKLYKYYIIYGIRSVMKDCVQCELIVCINQYNNV